MRRFPDIEKKNWYGNDVMGWLSIAMFFRKCYVNSKSNITKLQHNVLTASPDPSQKTTENKVSGRSVIP